MTNEQYQALWGVDDGSRTYLAIDVSNDKDLGNIVASSFEEANVLLERGMGKGIYPITAIIVELVSWDEVLN